MMSRWFILVALFLLFRIFPVHADSSACKVDGYKKLLYNGLSFQESMHERAFDCALFTDNDVKALFKKFCFEDGDKTVSEVSIARISIAQEGEEPHEFHGPYISRCLDLGNSDRLSHDEFTGGDED